MVIKSKTVLRWVLEHQHKLKQANRCCHIRAAVQEPLPLTENVEVEHVQVPTIKHNKTLRHSKSFKRNQISQPQDIGKKTFLSDITYRFDEARLNPQRSFKYSELEVTLAGPDLLRPKPDVGNIQFGKYFTDHMLKIYYHKALGGWQKPTIVPFENIALHPAAKVLHYAVELFEGMKAYRGVDGRIRMFRPLLNMERMNASAVRSGLPTFDSIELARCIERLVSIDQEWIPYSEASSLYIRPTLIGIDGCLGVASADSALLYTILSPVGSYFTGDRKSVSLLANPKYTRSWDGGCGDRKLGSNYGPTIRVQSEANLKGRQQPLWLYGEDNYITEVGTMNFFMLFINENGEKELTTPPIDGLILPGITRHSILQLAKGWNEFKVTEKRITMEYFTNLLSENRILEAFGVGTACIVSPIDSIEYIDNVLYIPTMEQKNPIYNRIYKTLIDIQYGRIEHPWADIVN